MTSKLGRLSTAALLGASLAFAAGLAPAAAQEELRIGLIAPMTGPFAQVGTDMTNGFDRATYRQRVTHFTEELKFMSSDDLDWVMGKAILARLNWN